MAEALRVGMVGYAFMGRAHSAAWRNVHAAFATALRPEMRVLCGRDEVALAAAAERLGWSGTEGDWRALVERDDVDLVDVCTPGWTHAEIVVAALEAGKHVLCEKPMANSVAEAESMLEAARAARERSGAIAMVGFNYRRVPALALARQLVAAGALGPIRHVRARYLQDWLSDPGQPATWRLNKQEAGSGALGDIASHALDLAQHLSGQRVEQVTALTETFVAERPAAGGSGLATGGAGGRADGSVPVTVDDAAAFLARLSGGAVGTFEATRMATGSKNGLQVMLEGEAGAISFDLHRLNELEVYDATAGRDAGWRRVLVTEPGHPYLSGGWPPGHVLGWADTFTHQAFDLLEAIATGEQPSPSFEEGLAVQQVLAAVESSAATGAWTAVAGAAVAAGGARR